MSSRIDLPPRTLLTIALAMFFCLFATAAIAQTIQGSATYRERMALPPAAVFEAVLQDVSRADAPGDTIASTRIASPGNPPIAFTITYDAAKILSDHRYTVRTTILLDGKPLFTSDTAAPVITRGSPTGVDIVMRHVASGQTTPAIPAAARPLEGTYWKAIELAGTPTPVQDPKREAHLTFQAGGRVSGSDGCNQIAGSYQLKGDAITFGQGIATQMACPDTGEIARAFLAAMKSAARLRIAGDRLELSDATGKRLAAFVAGTQASAPPASSGLAGTSWQLVRFQGGDGATLTPDDRAKYTIDFVSGGQLSARLDCNRGRGTWTSSGPNQLEFGPLALTRAQCPEGSLHDHLAKQWSYVRSYVVKDGHLFLSLMADGGIYEFEPVAKPKP